MPHQGKNNCDRYPQSAYTKLSNILNDIWLVAPLFPIVDLADEAGNSPLATVFQPAWLPAHSHECEAIYLTRCEEPRVLTLSPPAPECG